MSTTSALGLRSTPFNPATLPLLSTSLGLFYAFVEPTIFIPFLRSSEIHPAQAATITRVWWYNFLVPGLGTILTIGTANLVGGIYTLRSLQRNTTEWRVAAVGLTFAVGHFAFGPKIAGVVEKICDIEVEKKGQTMNTLRQWLNVHFWRTCTTDIPAVACFAWLVFSTSS